MEIDLLQILVKTIQAMSQLHKDKKRKQNRISRMPTSAIFIDDNFSGLSLLTGGGGPCNTLQYELRVTDLSH